MGIFSSFINFSYSRSLFINSNKYNKIFIFTRYINYSNSRNNSINRNGYKKIIALSTLRQLGIMMIVLGIGNPILSFFHLISHAFFKAMLFICAGIIIHNIKDYQDIRKIGFSYINIHFCISIIIIANISLCGLPFLRGFYSKDFIIEIILIKGKNIFFFIFNNIWYNINSNLFLSFKFIN